MSLQGCTQEGGRAGQGLIGSSQLQHAQVLRQLLQPLQDLPRLQRVLRFPARLAPHIASFAALIRAELKEFETDLERYACCRCTKVHTRDCESEIVPMASGICAAVETLLGSTTIQW